jgi:VIT1/CCC1 family predicted Fe2+/Mn2+ transporter
MRKNVFLLTVGVLVFITPLLGIPESWRAVLLFVLGALVILGAIACRLSARRHSRVEEDVFYEERSPQPDTHSAV